MTRVWDDETITSPVERLVLLALADYSNDECRSWPSIARVAQRSLVSERTLYRILSKLKESGKITIESGGGKHQTNVYTITLTNGHPNPDTVSGLRGVTLTSTTPNPVTGDTKPCHPCHPNRQEPSFNRGGIIASGGISWFDPDEDPEAGKRRRWEAVKKWMADWNSNGAAYSESQVRRSWLHWEGKGWMSGMNPVRDPRAAVESTIYGTSKKASRKGPNI